ncbi:MAG: hypothetical protein GQ535_03765 [Rhodobacteraceae bacterium]|nr:hypothetical protein [Paracoccaceae bacterium]
MKQQLSKLQSLCSVPLALNFFGHNCIAWLSPQDLDSAEFIFRHHIGTYAAEMKTHVLLYAEGGFFRSLFAKDLRLKTVIGIPTDGTDPVFHHNFRGWSGVPSVLPPFFTKDLKDRFTVASGSVLSLPGQNKGWILQGKNYSGKSSLAMALCQRGFGLVSDHLVIQDRNTNWCAGYRSPIGLRHHNYAAFKSRENIDKITFRETVSEVTGPVALVHVEDLLLCPAPPQMCDPVLSIEIQRAPTSTHTKLSANLHDRPGPFTPRTMTLTVPETVTPDVIADFLVQEYL